MNKRFKSVSFDLSQNLLYFGKLEQLIHHSLIQSVAHCMKVKNIHEKLARIFVEGIDISISIDEITESLHLEMNRQFDFKLKLLVSYVRFTINFVLKEACNFFKTIEVYVTNASEKNLFTKNLVFTSIGTVNTKKTILRTLKMENISADLKFKMAAQFFLGDQIVYQYFIELSYEEWRSFSNIDVVNDFELFFWIWKMAYITKKIDNVHVEQFLLKGKEFININNTNYIYYYIFIKAAEKNNEIAVYYMWNTILNENYRMNLLNTVIYKYLFKDSHVNIIMFLILETKKDQMVKFFKENSYTIPMMFLNRQKWCMAFLSILKVIKVYIKYNDYYNILLQIFAEFQKKSPNRTQLGLFKDLIMEIPPKDKAKIREFNDPECLFFFLSLLSFSKVNKDLIKSFLDICSNELIFKFFNSDSGVDLIARSIENLDLKFCDKILNKYMDKEQVRKIKNKIFMKKSTKLCLFLMYNNFDELNRFVNWFTLPDNRNPIQEVKHTYPFLEIIKQIIFPEQKYSINSELLLYADKILGWCVGENFINLAKLGIVLHLKEQDKALLGHIKCYENIRELIIQSNFSYLWHIINWKNCSDEEKLYLGNELLTDELLFNEMLKKKDYFECFKDLCSWVIEYLGLNERQYEVRLFKLHFFRERTIFLPLATNWELHKIKEIIVWCNPSKITIQTLWASLKPIMYKNPSKIQTKQLKKFSQWLSNLRY